MTKIIYNGKIIEERDANISITDKGYFFDFAVYSSIKVIQGKIFFPDYHIARLFESAKLIGLEHNFSEKEILDWLNKLIEINKIKDSLLRAVLIGDADDDNKAKLFIFPISGLTYYPNKLYKHGVKVITYHGERLIPRAKTKNLLMGFMALREARQNEAIEALLVDGQGNIREGTRTNFFAIKNKTIFTSPPDEVLEGITRKIILEIAKKDFDIKHENIPANKLKKYDEFFITSTSMNVMPIRQIDDTVFDTDFKETKFIAKLFKEYYDREVFGKE